MSNEKQPDVFDTGARTPQQIQYAKDLKEASIAAMNGILAGADKANDNSIYVNNGFIHPGSVAIIAVNCAKSLLKRLEEEGK